MANIWTATSDGDFARVRELVEADKALVNAKDENGYTPMHAASSWKHLDLLKYLIDNGGDVNITDSDGDTPLHICEDKECALLLLEHCADPSVENDEGMTPVHTTLENEVVEVTEVICKHLDIAVPKLEEVVESEQAEGSVDSITDAKLEDLSNWLLQNVDENSEGDEDALREMVTRYVMQSLRISDNKDDSENTATATVATSTGKVSQDDDSTSD
ncbi:ankyrin repeat-containing domain protein [Kickxella alabastrina]|uniref:ankyrin repeat-containing domain protein n=1 Tax=Kickxella alabastrina TaxID=61397 RepID=UPI002220972B|nr:ankyrin repeat-containing domain protein [Kickxella alabastrina]KAI7823900.1 ankyrin repeat-containing domain protein [Kickxella alabastrina]